MNLIDQFPDVSLKMREKFKLRKKSYQWKNVNSEITYHKDLVMTKFYDNEFKKRHFKLIFIVFLLVASLYFIAFNLSWLLK